MDGAGRCGGAPSRPPGAQFHGRRPGGAAGEGAPRGAGGRLVTALMPLAAGHAGGKHASGGARRQTQSLGWRLCWNSPQPGRRRRSPRSGA